MGLLIAGPPGLVGGLTAGAELGSAAAAAMGATGAVAAVGSTAGVGAAAALGATTATAMGASAGTAAAAAGVGAANAAGLAGLSLLTGPAAPLVAAAMLTTTVIMTVGAEVQAVPAPTTDDDEEEEDGLRARIKRAGITATFTCWRELVDADALSAEDEAAFAAAGLPFDRLGEFCAVEDGLVVRSCRGERFRLAPVFASDELVLLHAERMGM